MVNCFGSFTDKGLCNECSLVRQCKSYLLTDGLDIAAAAIELLMEGLEEGALDAKVYVNTDWASVQLASLYGFQANQTQKVSVDLSPTKDYSAQFDVKLDGESIIQRVHLDAS